ncbi:hypothetical protein ES702_02321 [subsurface metagenome]
MQDKCNHIKNTEYINLSNEEKSKDQPFLLPEKEQQENNNIQEAKLYYGGNIQLALTLPDLAKLVIFKFGSLHNFGSKLGISRTYVCHILKGDQTLKKPDTIQKWADVLQISPIVLTQLFSKVEAGK